MKLSDLYLDRYLYRDNNQSLETKGSAFVSQDSSEAEPSFIPSGGAAEDINTGNVPINPGALPDNLVNLGDWGWTQSCVFSSTDTDTVSWGAGTFTAADGTAYSIGAGNTGNMAAKTYIYLDINVSETAYQTSTTSSDAVGVGKVLIGVAKNESDAATYNLTEAEQIVGDNILVNTIDAGKIVTGSITATQITGSTLSAIYADLGTITAGSITVVNGGNTVGFTPNGTNAIFSGTTGSPQFKVTPAGVLTATGANISGSVTITGGSGISNLTDAGSLAVLDEVGASNCDTTIISGGKIITGLLTASNIQTGTLNASVVTVTNINASNISTGTLSADRIGASSITATKLNVTSLSSITASLGTITSGTIKVSTSVAVQKSDTTAVAYLGRDPDALGLWGFIANRGYGLMCRYASNNYFRIFMDSGSTDAVIDLPSPDKLKFQDNSGAAIARMYGNSSWGGSPGGLFDLFHPMRLYTYDYGGGTSGGPEAGSYASEGMMYVRLNYGGSALDNIRVYVGGAWRSVTTS